MCEVVIFNYPNTSYFLKNLKKLKNFFCGSCHLGFLEIGEEFSELSLKKYSLVIKA